MNIPYALEQACRDELHVMSVMSKMYTSALSAACGMTIYLTELAPRPN